MGAENIARFWRFNNERYQLEGNRDPRTGEVYFPPRIAPFSNNGHKEDSLSDVGDEVRVVESTEKGNNGSNGKRGIGIEDTVEIVVYSSEIKQG